MSPDSLAIVPGYSLGFFTLGSSLQEVLSAIKEDKTHYPTIELSFSQTKPLSTPVAVGLPQNGLRLRFDGSDQRLRLIEVVDPTKTKITFKGSELAKRQDEPAAFKRIYQLFGASYPGEYIQPDVGSRTGTYILSWPGIAFNFPLQHSAWSPEKDHVSLLGSHAAQPATHIAVFEGNSWPEARGSLFVKTPTGPRTAAIASQPRDFLPAELEWASVKDAGEISFVRRAPALPFNLVLGQTTPQDLLTELGPPNAFHKREPQSRPEQPVINRRGSNARSLQNGFHSTPPSSYGSTGTDTFETDFQDSADVDDDPSEKASREVFWCYFGHGLDILVGPPSGDVSGNEHVPVTPVAASPHLVVLRVVVHGNVPGSYAFNRHRRLRWALDLQGTSSTLTSEHSFDDIKPDLMQAFHGARPESEFGRGKVVNRSWGGGSTESSFNLMNTEDADMVASAEGSEEWIRNTFLHNLGGGLTFEVASNGAITALTVS